MAAGSSPTSLSLLSSEDDPRAGRQTIERSVVSMGLGSVRELGRTVAAIVLDRAGCGHEERAARLQTLRRP
jgi:hypothetical protein